MLLAFPSKQPPAPQSAFIFAFLVAARNDVFLPERSASPLPRNEDTLPKSSLWTLSPLQPDSLPGVATPAKLWFLSARIARPGVGVAGGNEISMDMRARPIQLIPKPIGQAVP